MLYLPDNLFLYLIYYIQEAKQKSLTIEDFVKNEKYEYVKEMFDQVPEFHRLYNDDNCLDILKVVLEYNSSIRDFKDKLESYGKIKSFFFSGEVKRLKFAFESLKARQKQYYLDNFSTVVLTYVSPCFNVSLEE